MLALYHNGLSSCSQKVRLALAEKDLNLITAFAERLEVPVPQAHVNRDVLREAMAGGHAGADFADVAVHLRRG